MASQAEWETRSHGLAACLPSHYMVADRPVRKMSYHLANTATDQGHLFNISDKMTDASYCQQVYYPELEATQTYS